MLQFQRDPRINITLFLLALMGTVIAQVKGWHGLEFVCRPAMMVILSFWFYHNSRRFGDRFTLLVQGGLFFSLVGDIAFMFQHVDEFNFLLGIAALLIAQLFYTLAFAQNAVDVGDLDGLFVSLLLAVGIVAYGFFFSYDLMRYLDGDIAIPVLAFMITAVLMGIGAGLRFKRTFPRSFWIVLIGALLFIVSDSLLVRDRFARPIAYGNVMIMLTYGTAQLLFAAGSLFHVLDPEEIKRRQALRT